MSDINRVTLIGRLTRDPELRHTQNGTAVSNFSIAVSRTWSKDGEKQEEVSFIDCEAWAKTAEVIVQYVKKGHRVGLEGRLKQDSWDDNETGKKRSKLKIVVDNFQFLQPKSDESNNGDHSPGGINRDNQQGDKPFSDDDIPF